jgi:hypothetical protein
LGRDQVGGGSYIDFKEGWQRPGGQKRDPEAEKGKRGWMEAEMRSQRVVLRSR